MARSYQKKFNKKGFILLTALLCAGIFSLFYAQPGQARTAFDKNGSIPAQIAPGFVDGGFNPVIGTGNVQLITTIIQPDGKILVSGYVKAINGVNRNGIARFNVDGTLDASFNTGAGPDDSVYGIGLQLDGKIIISGVFTSYDGVPVNKIARLNTDGSLDQSFNKVGLGMNSNGGANNEISVVKVLPDDKILIGGYFTNYNGTPQNRLARLNADGSLDTTFVVGSGANGAVIVITTQDDGKILIGGDFSAYGGTLRPKLARVNIDGSLDTSFTVGTGADETVSAIVVQPDGYIIVGGFFQSFNNAGKNGLMRLKGDGSFDASFNVAGLDAVVTSVALQPDGKMIVAGSFTAIAGVTRQCIARLNADGTMDSSFDPGTGVGAQVIWDLALQANGKLIAVGTFTVYNGTPNGGAVRISADGALDTTLAASSNDKGNVYSMAIQPDGKIMIGGLFTSVNGGDRTNIARLNANGTSDTTFNPGTGANNTVLSLAVQADGKTIVGGNFTTFNGGAANRIVRLNSDGTIDTGFATGTGMNGTLDWIALQPSDGKILVGGAFTTYNGVTVNRFARLNTDGTLDTSFATGTSSNGQLRSIVVQPDGKILIGGAFTNYNGTSRNRIARINVDGTLDTTFNPGTGAANIVSSLSLQADGKVVIGGTFTAVNGVARNRIARLQADGTLDAGFNPGIGPGPGTATEVTRVLSVANNKTLIAGNFRQFNNLPRNRVTRLNADGTLDNSFLSGNGVLTQAGLTMRSMIQQPDGQILISGQFSVFNVSARTGIARFSNASDTFADYDGDGKTDFSIIRPTGNTSTWWVNLSGSDNTATFNFGLTPNDIPQTGDFDGDGKDDIAVWRNSPAGGEPNAFYIIESSTNATRVIPFGLEGDIPVVEDYDGDGRDDISVWRAPAAASGAGQATWYYVGSLNNPNNNITYVQWGMRYGTQADQVDVPYPGDFDGDGRADFRVKRRADITVTSPHTQTVFLTLSATGSTSYEYFGLASDRTLPGDYDGDGKTDICVVRGADTPGSEIIWYFRYTSGRADDSISFGRGPNLNFAQGDYDGDGATDIALFIDGNFWWRAARDGSVAVKQWGQSGDLPVAGFNNR